jgi:hypothetical protein
MKHHTTGGDNSSTKHLRSRARAVAQMKFSIRVEIRTTAPQLPPKWNVIGAGLLEENRV